MGIQYFNRGGYWLRRQHPPLKILDAHPLLHHRRWAKQKISSFILQLLLETNINPRPPKGGCCNPQDFFKTAFFFLPNKLRQMLPGNYFNILYTHLLMYTG